MSETDKETPSDKVAVALHYGGADGVPRVTAKGKGELASQIVEVARAAGVPVEHNEPLAKSLCELELDQQIPKELYRAVAEVIGFILRKAGQGGRAA
jgi:flagellar biosynthesis protein